MKFGCLLDLHRSHHLSGLPNRWYVEVGRRLVERDGILGLSPAAASFIWSAVFAGLAGAILLGPRIGRYSADAQSIPIPGHNVTFTTLGVFLLLIGWYGFNPGSQFGAPVAPLGSADVSAYGLIANNTTLAACSGCVLALITAWVLFRQARLDHGTQRYAGWTCRYHRKLRLCYNMESLIVGAVAGVLVTLAVIILDKIKIDDPVGAFPVHGVCGAWA